MARQAIDDLSQETRLEVGSGSATFLPTPGELGTRISPALCPTRDCAARPRLSGIEHSYADVVYMVSCNL